MQPIDYRNETFAAVQSRICGQRAAVLSAWLKHGPATTAELAERSGLSILTLRPRTTELVELGFVRLAEVQTAKGEGTYTAVSPAEAAAHFHRSQIAALNPQTELALSLS